MSDLRRRYLLAAACVAFFILAQILQSLAYTFWIPETHAPEEDLAVYNLAADQIRALVILSAIALLTVPFVVIVLRYRDTAPLAALLGLIFAMAFVGFEMSARGVEFFVVGQNWAQHFESAGSPQERTAMLERFALWNEVSHGWYFALMGAYLLASCAFATATLSDADPWSRVATVAFGLNALRLLGRMLSTFGGQDWLAGLNDRLYLISVLIVNTLLFAWLVHLAKVSTPERPNA